MVEAINWETALAAPRSAGGHQQVMESIFGLNARIAESWHEGDYQGSIVYAYEFTTGGFCVITDSYGSCSGCDAWEDASDEAARNMITTMVSSARFFESFGELLVWTEQLKAAMEHYKEHYEMPPGQAEDYLFREAGNLHVPLARQIGARLGRKATDTPAVRRMSHWDEKT